MLMIVLTLVLPAWACGSSPQRSQDAGSADAGAQDGGSSDGGTQDAGAQDAGPDCVVPDAGAPCNTINYAGPNIEEIKVAQNPPVLTGGTILAGTYAMTALTLYTGTGGASGSTGRTLQSTFVYTPTSSQSGTAQSIDKESSCNLRQAFTVTTSGLRLTAALTCPRQQSLGSCAYQASATTLMLICEPGRLQTFTRQ
jgi:hypothetical protein